MHLAPLIKDLALILAVAGIISLIFQKIRQPVVLGYILAGLIVGPHTPPFQLITDIPSIQTWAELGVIFLMFSLGLEFSFIKLAKVGISATITALVEVTFFLTVGIGLGHYLGWSTMDGLFLGAMLSISSTTIIIKALDELKLKKNKFATLIFGVLIVEDLMAILLLVVLTTVANSSTFSVVELTMAASKLLLVVSGWFITGYFILPRFMRFVGKTGNNELITVISVGLCLALVVFANHFQYSTALGAFIMGSILAESNILHKIEEQMTPLRDLFGAIFFVSIGMLIDPHLVWENIGLVGLLCVITILGKIASTSFGSVISGQPLKDSIQVGFGLAQIGEFSFIIATLGLTLKATSEFLYPVAVAVSLFTTFTTPYLIKYSGKFADVIEASLPENMINRLNRYAAWTQEVSSSSANKKQYYKALFIWLFNGLMVSIIFILGSQFLVPLMEGKAIIPPFWMKPLAWIFSLVAAGPFIWAMLYIYKKFPVDESINSKNTRFFHLMLTSGLTLVWIELLSSAFFPVKLLLPISASIFLLYAVFFYKRLESTYKTFEKTFLSTFDRIPKQKSQFSYLAPWDIHLIKMEIHPNAPVVLKTLSESGLRTKYAINVVAIQRGSREIIAPNPQEVLLPKDELIMLGNDEQLNKVRHEFEIPVNLEEHFPLNTSYELRHYRLLAGSELIGRTVATSGIRENYHSIVVGVERLGIRKINPDSFFAFKEGDLIWLVGEKNYLDQLTTTPV